MKKAVIKTGGRQYLVTEGELITVNLVATDKKTISFNPLMIIDGKSITVGTPIIEGSSVVASVIEADVQANKVIAIRYKAKKRVHKIRGHRQRETKLKITSIK